MQEQVTKDTKLAMECVALGCQRDTADTIIQALRTENSVLRTELTRTIDILSTLGVRIESVLGKQS